MGKLEDNEVKKTDTAANTMSSVDEKGGEADGENMIKVENAPAPSEPDSSEAKDNTTQGGEEDSTKPNTTEGGGPQEGQPPQQSTGTGQTNGGPPPPHARQGPPPPGYPPYHYGAPPPPGGEGTPGYPPPPRGYEGSPYPPGYPPPYGMYPPPPYGMYPPYQHPMYGGGPHQPPPGYYPQDPSMQAPPGRYPEGGPEGPHGHYGAPPPGGPIAPRSDDDRKAQATRAEGDENQDDEQGEIVPGAVTARLKTYIKPRIPSTQEVLDRRSRKNAQSRSRASKLRGRIGEIDRKPESERSEEEMHLWAQYENRRRRKNDRSRERALEKKEEIDRILTRPDKKRTKIERQFLETALGAKKRKNEGDRLRRQRLKELGLSTKGTGIKPGISARGPLPQQYQHLQHQQMQQHGYPPMGHYPPPGQMGDIPMSPLPTMPGHPHHPMQSSPSGYGSPGMMPNINFPSPSRRPQGTPGRPDGPHPYMHPGQPYAQEQARTPTGSSQSQQQQSSRVEQRRHADGSMSMTIGGRAAGGSTSFSAPQGDLAEVSDLLLDNDNGYGEGGQQGQEEKPE